MAYIYGKSTFADKESGVFAFETKESVRDALMTEVTNGWYFELLREPPPNFRVYHEGYITFEEYMRRAENRMHL